MSNGADDLGRRAVLHLVAAESAEPTADELANAPKTPECGDFVISFSSRPARAPERRPKPPDEIPCGGMKDVYDKINIVDQTQRPPCSPTWSGRTPCFFSSSITCSAMERRSEAGRQQEIIGRVRQAAQIQQQKILRLRRPTNQRPGPDRQAPSTVGNDWAGGAVPGWFLFDLPIASGIS
jgi:hypothetical protein